MSRQTARANSRVLRGVLAGHLRVWPLSRAIAGHLRVSRDLAPSIFLIGLCVESIFLIGLCRIDFFDLSLLLFFLTPDLPPSLSLGCSKGKL